jgi:maltose-binding protein MalE
MNWKMINPGKVKFNQAFRIVIAVLMLAVVLLVGCQGQSLLESVFPDTEALVEATVTPPVAEEQAAEATPTATATTLANTQLTVWVPPQFSPYEDTQASQLLSSRFKAFMTQNPQINLDIRVKSASGASSILDTITYASQVAPSALPSLVLISRSDLEIAAQKGLIQPIEEISTTIDEDDWFAFSQAMAIVQGTAYGLPFAADVLSLVYQNSSLTSSQPDWDELLLQFDNLIFPAADQSVLATLALYLSAGGSIQDAQGQAFIDVEILTQVLEAYARGVDRGVLDESLLELQNDDQAWEVFQESGDEGLITWASRQMQNEEDLKLAALPVVDENSITLAKGWVWCLVEQDPQDQENAALLAEYLVEPGFLSEWAPLSGYMPVRPSSVAAWENSVYQEIIAAMLDTAQLRPNVTSQPVFNTSIKTAVQEVLTEQNDPALSAQKALESLVEVVE